MCGERDVHGHQAQATLLDFFARGNGALAVPFGGVCRGSGGELQQGSPMPNGSSAPSEVGPDFTPRGPEAAAIPAVAGPGYQASCMKANATFTFPEKPVQVQGRWPTKWCRQCKQMH
eukprot:2376728-Alexandrium_andersonii.AAC.1